jgi:hypothetical protein
LPVTPEEMELHQYGAVQERVMLYYVIMEIPRFNNSLELSKI